jgi:hypothetical protein
LAEGDKVVPSGGNPQLDPTRDNKWSSALNDKLGVTGPVLNETLGATGKELQSDRWKRNENGLLYDSYTENRDFEPNKAKKSVGSPNGEGAKSGTTNKYPNKVNEPKKGDGPKPSAALAGNFGGIKFKSQTMQMAADATIAMFPFQTLLPRCVGPFIPIVMNYQGGVAQSSVQEATNTGKVPNKENAS